MRQTISDIQGLARFYRAVLAVDVEPYLKKRGITDDTSARAEAERIVCRYVVVYLDIGGMPHLILARKTIAYMRDKMPVVVSVELVAVLPQIEKAEGLLQKSLRL